MLGSALPVSDLHFTLPVCPTRIQSDLVLNGQILILNFWTGIRPGSNPTLCI